MFSTIVITLGSETDRIDIIIFTDSIDTDKINSHCNDITATTLCTAIRN